MLPSTFEGKHLDAQPGAVVVVARDIKMSHMGIKRFVNGFGGCREGRSQAVHEYDTARSSQRLPVMPFSFFRIIGTPPSWPIQLAQAVKADLVVVEADGSRRSGMSVRHG